jgi:hypothetical protein
MRCQRCGKPISPLRQLTDREFCCDDHRRRGARASASAVRDLDFTSDPMWEVPGQAPPKHASHAGSSLGLVLLVAVGVLVAAKLWMPDSLSDPAAAATPAANSGSGMVAGAAPRPTTSEGFASWVEDHLPGQKPLRASTDFRSNLEQWVGEKSTSSERAWKVDAAGAHPGALRIWRPTLDKSDYDVHFEAAIEHRAVAWAFRAVDVRHYYAAKVVLTRPGVLSGAVILRYVVNNDRTEGRSELPLPVVLQVKQPYQVSFTVRGDRFSTFINGNLIDEWSDTHFKKGGVGFFNEESDSAAIQWVAFRERKTWLSRVFATTLLLPPGMMQ